MADDDHEVATLAQFWQQFSIEDVFEIRGLVSGPFIWLSMDGAMTTPLGKKRS
jgi:hypothetical protein